jgi:hypothetical protein
MGRTGFSWKRGGVRGEGEGRGPGGEMTQTSE